MLTRPSQILLSIIRNLGLNRLLKVATDFTTPEISPQNNSTELKALTLNELETAKLILEAHENLINANPDTQATFIDVVQFLKERISPCSQQNQK